MTKFWDHYARLNDETRAKVIDEGWFQKRTSETPMQDDVATMRSQPGYGTEDSAVYASVYGRDPHVDEAIEGIGARGPDNMNGESTKEAVDRFYGRDNRESDELIASANELYGYDEQETDAQTLYGYDTLDDVEHDEPER